MNDKQVRNSRLRFMINKSADDPLIQLSSSKIYQNSSFPSPASQQKFKIRLNTPSKQQFLEGSPHSEKSRPKFPTDQQLAKFNRMSKFSSSSRLELDPRDQRINLPFESAYYPLLQKHNFEISFEPFQNQLRDWLVDLIEISTSIGFNHLQRETLIQKQVKAFISKNVLENIKDIFQRYDGIPLQNRYNLIEFINDESFQIFDHIAKKYPLTSSKGVSKRIKSKIQTIDNRQSEQFDFLLRNNIHIRYRQDADYSQDIMKIMNKLISYSNQVFDNRMELQQTNYQIFTQVMEYIFDNAYSQPIANTAKEVVQLLCDKKHRIDNQMSELQRQACTEGIEMQQKLSQDTRKSMKDSHKQVLIGHKIPIGVPLFTEQDIQSSNFKVYDSSILRLLTKWAEELRSKIMNAQQTILRRMFKFKSLNGRLLNLEPTMKQLLYEESTKKIQKIESFLKNLKEQNYFLQTIFAEQKNFGRYSKHDTKIGIFAAKINEAASQYIFKYINQLIHCLLSIPRKAAQRVTNDRQKALISSVDLLTFKIGDMMRCKCSCSQQQFIKVLQVIDEIHTRAPYVIKLVRIKNRLQTQNNDILINFFFGNKAQCELQLSVLSSQKKHEKNSSVFSHFVYEIIRAQLGPLSQMANILVQYDPLAYFYSKKKSLGPQLLNNKKKQILCKKQPDQHILERGNFRKKKGLNLDIEFPFVCCGCGGLAVVHNPSFHYRDLSIMKRQCNECLNEVYKRQCVKKEKQNLKQKVRANILSQNFQDEQSRTFCNNHLQYWDSNGFIQGLKDQTEQKINNMWFPPEGFMIRKNQKKPIFQLFTCIYQQHLSHVFFSKIDAKGEKKLLALIKIYSQKQKKIKTIEKQLENFILFTFKQIEIVVDNGVKYFKCKRQNCCGLKINPGPIFQRETMIKYKNQRRVQKSIQSQKTHLDLNYVTKAFQLLQKQLGKITQRNKLWKIRTTVQVIEAFSCKLQNIKVVSMFIQLTDLNIGENKQLKNLKGLQGCFNLKYLDCKNCDLQSINQLSDLKKLQEINLTNNTKLNSIQSLSSHTELINLYLRNTLVQSLAPLEKCLKLQAIDLQGCKYITTLKHIHSHALNYISIINCLAMLQFDLPDSALKSLKNVELYKTDVEIMMAGFIADFSLNNLVLKSTRNVSANSNSTLDQQAITKINQILKIRRVASA